MTKTSKELTPPQKKLVEEVMDNFDFVKVRQVMHELDWQWWDVGLPSVEQIRQKARQMLNRCVRLEGAGLESTGGFCVDYDNIQSQQDYILRLSFEIEERTARTDGE
jgi:hypothetical protein